MTHPLHDRVVAALGDLYELDREIGRGGMSVVYRARDRRLNRLVAIKVLPPELAYDPSIRLRFTREAQTAAQLEHAHIVPIYDVGERDGIAYFVMALVTGGNLAELLAREPRLPVDEVRRVLREIADALAYAHQRGVIHRDIKPDNVLLDGTSGRVMVTDFGIARAIEAGTRLTVTGAAVGTPTYMSPEQAVGEREIDGRTDLYALGVIGYQMLTGRVPFTAGNPMALLLKHVGERPRPIAALRPDAPPALRDALERALLKEPDDRWPTATAFRDALSGEPPVRRAELYAAPRNKATEGVPLSALTPAQRTELRLWNGRIDLLDRIVAARGYAVLTIGAVFLGMVGFVVGVTDAPPFVLSPIVPAYMGLKLWRRGKSLQQSGVSLKRLLRLRARSALPVQTPVPTQAELEQLAPRAVLQGPEGEQIRQAASDRAAILHMLGAMTKGERALLPDVATTVNALVERVVTLAKMLHDLGQEIDPRLRNKLETHRTELRGQLESAALALGNIRLDLIRVRSSGLQSGFAEVTSATQQARALSREIAVALEAAAELRNL
jgi:hypothetical protein